MADRALAYLGSALNWYAGRDDDFTVPRLKGLKRASGRGRDRVLQDDEIRAVWKAAETNGVFGAVVRFLLLTGQRRGDVYGMTWTELDGDTWTIPAVRMKADKKHEVPLTPLAVKQLPFQSVSDVSLAKCIARHTDAPATTHGFRSTFRDWAGDRTTFPREIAEMALAHVICNETEAAYRRGAALEKRRELMIAWAEYCSGAR